MPVLFFNEEIEMSEMNVASGLRYRKAQGITKSRQQF